MEYRQLEYFLKICETGSISRAAAKLYISQQALSKNIENLENSLGLPLFYRSPPGANPDPLRRSPQQRGRTPAAPP